MSEGSVSSDSVGSVVVLSGENVRSLVGDSDGSGSGIVVELGSPSLGWSGELGNEVVSSLLVSGDYNSVLSVGNLGEGESSST